MKTTKKKISYIVPMITVGTITNLYAGDEESWTWSQFAGTTVGGAVGGAAAGAVSTTVMAGVAVPGAGLAALAGGAGGAVGGAVGYSLTVAFG